MNISAFSASCLIVAGLSLCLSLFILVKEGYKDRIRSLWSLACFGVAVWSGGMGFLTHTTSEVHADIYLKIHYFGLLILLATFFHFIHAFLQIRNRFSVVAIYVWSCILQVFNLSGSLSKATPNPKFSFFTTPGPLFPLYLCFLVPTIFYTHFLLFKSYQHSSGSRRNQIFYLFLATGIGFIGGLTTLFPVFNWDVFPFGMYFIFLYVLIVFYAIHQHHLMDITVIVRKTLIYSAVTGISACLYLGTITLFAHFFQGLTGTRTAISPAIAAGLVTLCFQPIRKRIQSFIDSKFFRHYVDREEKLYELSREVVTHTTPEAMGQALMRVINETLHPKFATLYLRTKNGRGFHRYSLLGDKHLVENMPEDNSLAAYFLDHPQPFVQDLPETAAESQDTRRAAPRAKVA
jgi:hypothetical protein